MEAPIRILIVGMHLKGALAVDGLVIPWEYISAIERRSVDPTDPTSVIQIVVEYDAAIDPRHGKADAPTARGVIFETTDPEAWKLVMLDLWRIIRLTAPSCAGYVFVDCTDARAYWERGDEYV